MNFTVLDWTAIIAYLAVTLFLGLYFRSRSGKSVDDYFVSGRNVSWWLAGTSMVATTFAADTPLVVTGLVYRNGIAGNWFWWSFLPSGMMTVFLFARLWRRSGLLTDVQFAEMRYAGKPAAFLRGFRALYLGLLMNCLILGCVTKAMTAIVAASLGVSESTSKWICVLVLIPFTGLYVNGIRTRTQIHFEVDSLTPKLAATMAVIALVTQPRIRQFISKPRYSARKPRKKAAGFPA